MIHVAMAANRNYFAGLSATLLSLLRSNKSNCFCVNIIDGGLSALQKRFLKRKVSSANSENQLVFHSLNEGTFRGFTPDYGNSYMTYARILIGSLLLNDRVIYLDTDLLIAANIKPLWDLNLDGKVVAAAPDPSIKHLKDDHPSEPKSCDSKYFNSGVIVIDLNAWREIKAQDQLLRMIRESPERYRWWDQTAMNSLFEGRVLFVDPSWNTFADSVDFKNHTRGRIFHYVGGAKPWSRYLNSPEYKLWRSFYGKHVLWKTHLLSNRKFLWSYFEHLRHKIICSSPFLQRLALGILQRRRFPSEEAKANRIEEFVKIHTASSDSSTTENVPNRSVVDDYVAKRWD